MCLPFAFIGNSNSICTSGKQACVIVKAVWYANLVFYSLPLYIVLVPRVTTQKYGRTYIEQAKGGQQSNSSAFTVLIG